MTTMRAKPSRYVLAVLAAAATTYAYPTAAQGAVVHSATGSGQVQIVAGSCAGAFRTFSFTVSSYGDGTVAGQSNVQVHAETATDPVACEAAVSSGAVGSFVHAELDCLNIFGNIASVSGTVTQTNEEFSANLRFTTVFMVQDNGEGANAEPDRITRIRPFRPDAPFQGLTPPVTCSSFSLPMIEAALARVDVGYAIEAGNVQVR